MINVRVRAIGPIYHILGVKEFDVALEAGATIESLLRHLVDKYGDALAHWAMDSEGHIIARHTRILINGKDLFVLNDIDTVLADGDVVSMMSAIAGGV